MAGPIERAAQLLPQITNPRPAPNLQRFASGGVLILIGLVRKVAIADVVAADVDQVFANAQNFGSLALLRAVVLFALQIYCDFAGYSDIARGTSRILGVELMENFAHPYFATSITDFWRRWHISLSTWLRDYLYIPLGGNRGSRLKTHRNLMLTMVLGGLWHGASWTFVVWGGLHGVALAANKAWNGLRGASPGRSRGISVLVKAAAWAGTMALVCVAWVFFRAPDFATAFNVLRGIVSFSGPLSVSLLMKPALMIALLLLIDVPQAWLRDHAALLRWPLPLRGFAYAGFVMLMIYLSTGENVPFIYFQF